MPTKNLYFVLIVVLLSIFISSKTSLKSQIALQVAKQLQKHCLETPSSDQLFQGALSGMTAAVGDDRYTEYIPPRAKNEYMLELQGQYAGVGLTNFIQDSKTGEFYFVPLRNSPAHKAGLQLGDRIVEIEGNNVSDMSIIDLTNLLRGEENTSVAIKIRPRSSLVEFQSSTSEPSETVVHNNSVSSTQEDVVESNELRDVTLVRAVVQQDIVSGDRIDSHGNWIYTLKDYSDIGYICINEFTDSTGRQTYEAINELERQGVSKIIMDFRGNPGGMLRDAVDICNEFLSDGSPIVETRNKKGSVARYVANRYPRRRFNVAILIDGGSASASEIVSAALQDAGVAKIIGERSYGKGTIQGIFELPGNLGVLRMTTASFWRPSGNPIHRKKGAKEDDEWGVLPDPGFEVHVSLVQKFYTSWIRKVRVLAPEASAFDAQTLGFMTQQTNDVLQRLIEGQGLTRLEAAAELGLDLSQISLDKPNSSQNVEGNPNSSDEQESLEEESSDENSTRFLAFKPLGRAPYYDPQLDKAIDYLLSKQAIDSPKPQQEKDLLEVDRQERHNEL